MDGDHQGSHIQYWHPYTSYIHYLHSFSLGDFCFTLILVQEQYHLGRKVRVWPNIWPGKNRFPEEENRSRLNNFVFTLADSQNSRAAEPQKNPRRKKGPRGRIARRPLSKLEGSSLSHTGSKDLCGTIWHQEHKMKFKEFSPLNWCPTCKFFTR